MRRLRRRISPTTPSASMAERGERGDLPGLKEERERVRFNLGMDQYPRGRDVQGDAVGGGGGSLPSTSADRHLTSVSAASAACAASWRDAVAGRSAEGGEDLLRRGDVLHLVSPRLLGAPIVLTSQVLAAADAAGKID